MKNDQRLFKTHKTTQKLIVAEADYPPHKGDRFCIFFLKIAKYLLALFINESKKFSQRNETDSLKTSYLRNSSFSLSLVTTTKTNHTFAWISKKIKSFFFSLSPSSHLSRRPKQICYKKAFIKKPVEQKVQQLQRPKRQLNQRPEFGQSEYTCKMI